VLPPAQRASGQRRYDPAVSKQLAIVTLAREAGFTIREIRALFRDFTPDTTAVNTPALDRRRQTAGVG
jgi:DNA-binding transcriptional MerR regulator